MSDATQDGMLAPLRYPPFRFLVTGRLVTMFGTAMAPIALAFAVLDLTGSVRDLGLVVAARSVVNVVFLLLGGVVADRLPRRLVMVVSSVLAAITQGMVATLVMTGTATVPLLMVLGAVNGMVSAFALPASAAILSQTIPDGIRKQANAINRLGFNASMIVGASVGGLLVATFGPGWGLIVDAATFIAAAACFGLVRVPAVRVSGLAAKRPSTVAELREGWREFTGRTWLLVVVVCFGPLNAAIVGGVQVLGPAVADGTVGRRVWGVVLAAQTAGMIAGGVLAMRLRVRRMLRLGVLCMAGQSLLLAALAIAPQAAVLIGCAFVAGMTLEQFGVAWETTMQQQIPADRLARVYSYDMLGSFIAIPAGEVAAGPLAQAIGTGPALLVAAGVVLTAVIGMLASRDVRRLEHRTPPVEPAPVGEVAAVPG
jgi:MFS family permease